MKHIFPILVGFGVLMLISCAERGLDILSPADSVTRQEALITSKAYTELCWTPGKMNIMHGVDPTGIRVDTPDKNKNDTSSYYWVPGEKVCGMAYKWGGFDTPKDFMIKIQSTYHPALVRNPAGDMPSPEKIRLGDAAVSPYAAGIDCSGFVSRCWRLEKPYSTRELPALCTKLKSYSEMKMGDILILPGEHVTMFLKWANPQKTEFIGSEAGGTKYWRALEKRYPLNLFRSKGYMPMRYKNIR